MENEKKVTPQPTNTYEARNWVFYESKLKGGARLLAYDLLGYWNMDGTGRCFPSLATLKEKTGYTTSAAIRKLIKELEASGEWAVVRGEKGATTHFYPMFVKNAKTQYLGQSEEQMKTRKELDAKRKERSAGKPKVEYVVPTTTPILTPTPTTDGRDKKEIELPATIHPSKQDLLNWINTSEQDLIDSGIISEEVFIENAPKLKPREIMEVLKKGDIHTYGIEQTVGVVDDGSARMYVSAVFEALYPTAYPGRWIKRYGNNYGRKFTHTEIWNIYLELILVDEDEMTQDRLDAIETAMWVLGRNGFMPSVNAAKALIYPVDKLTGKFPAMKEQYEETLKGREITTKLWGGGHYFMPIEPDKKNEYENARVWEGN